MTVFEIIVETDDFQYLVFADPKVEEEYDDLEILKFDGSSMAEGWKSFEVKVHKPKLKKGDFFGFTVGTFGVSPQAMEKAAMFFEMAGELLPVHYKGEEYLLLNVTQCIDCVEEKSSTWLPLPSGQKVLKIPAFESERFEESSIFKIPQHPGRIYCYEASKDPETEFKAFVEQEKMTGLSFRQIWTDEK
jgi:hypothetical protein